MPQNGRKEREKLWDMIARRRVAMLTTQDGGLLRGRPLASHPDPQEGVIWFFTNIESPKLEEVERRHQVCACYMDEKASEYISLSGYATLDNDPEKIDAFWSLDVAAWFPEGKQDPSLALLKLAPERAEYWDNPTNRLVQLWELSKANIAGEPPEIGDNRKFDALWANRPPWICR